MRAIVRSQAARQGEIAGPDNRISYRIAPSDENGGDSAGQQSSIPIPIEREDLPYKVEVWDESRISVGKVLAVTASGSVGYAGYYAATREHSHCCVTLRHENRIVSRWNGPRH